MARARTFSIKNFPPDVKAALMLASAERGCTLNDHAVSLLAERFDVEFVLAGRHAPKPAGPSEHLFLMMPLRLHDKIWTEARRRRTWPREVIVDVLTEQSAAAA